MLLYYITDRNQFPGTEQERRSSLVRCLLAAAEAGVDYIQLREKDLPISQLEILAREIRRALGRCSTKLLINSRIDVAIAAGFDGVHLRSGTQDILPSEARAIFHKSGYTSPVIAASCHTKNEVELAEAHGADFAVFAPVFGKYGQTNLDGLTTLRDVCERPIAASARMPVLALGGITLANAEACLRQGAGGIAGIRLFQQNISELKKIVAELRKLSHSIEFKPYRHPYQERC